MESFLSVCLAPTRQLPKLPHQSCRQFNLFTPQPDGNSSSIPSRKLPSSGERKGEKWEFFYQESELFFLIGSAPPRPPPKLPHPTHPRFTLFTPQPDGNSTSIPFRKLPSL
ncbi:hypothetical protein Csa_001964 [Cucumis sativus]|nr:hypothetical protein Csa_001964 [Cucumis sativus]